jgi:hypothetical protein
LSCIVAYVLPFELFLFSYAVLGPLHYLTEISWLHEHNYFTEDRPNRKRRRPHQGWLMLVAAAMAALIFGFVAVEVLKLPANPKWEITMFYLVFVTALLVTEVKSQTIKISLFIVALGSLVLFAGSRYYVIVAFFLVTIIHVLIFTGAFIFYGALKNRSLSGILSLVVFLACAISFFVYAPDASGHILGNYVRSSYRSFNGLNSELIKLLNLGSGTSAPEIYESRVGFMVMRLIAFANTYHYLNWFSKTSIIKWHEVSKGRAAVMIAVWLLSLALYAHDYDTGMAVLYFLSILHVMLEFPLDHRTFAGIGRELYAIAR